MKEQSIVLDGGKVITLEKAASRKGTEITITDLFYNTPARLKYMKTIHTELGNITDVTNRLALAHPEVSIRLFHNERKLLHTNGNGDVRQVLAAIYGINMAKKDDSNPCYFARFYVKWLYRFTRNHKSIEKLYFNDD